MNSEALKAYLQERPFRPFDVHLSSGQVYSVKHPECAFVMKNTLVIGDPEKEIVNCCSLIHITNVMRQESKAQ